MTYLKYKITILLTLVSLLYFGQNSPGVYPSILDDACINSSYSDTVKIVFIPDTTYSGFSLPIDSVKTLSYSNLPNGISATCLSLDCTTQPQSSGMSSVESIIFNGSPTSSVSNSSITIHHEYWVTIFGNATSLIDSTIVNLTIHSIDTSVTRNGNALVSNLNGASYQWINCADGTPIIGANNQYFSPNVNGEYAVIVTDNFCSDTSNCNTINNLVGLSEYNFEDKFLIYPNPSNGIFTLTLDRNYKLVTIKVINIQGKIIKSSSLTNKKVISFDIENGKGIYFIHIDTGDSKTRMRVVKN